MKEPLPHDFRAVLAAPGKALALKKIFASSCFLLLGYLLYLFFTYLALLFDGVGFGYIWQSYGMFPIKIFAFDAWAALVIQLAGVGLALLCVSLSLLAGAVISFEHLRGDFFFSAVDAIRFTIQRTPTLLLGFLSLGVFMGFIYLLGLVAGLVTRLPVIGELLLGVFYIIPIFITLVFTVFIGFVAVVSIVLLPVIVAAQKRKEVFDSLLQLFSVMIKEPIRFFWYLAVSTVLAKAASFAMAYLFYRTLQASRLILATSGGRNIEWLFNSAFGMLPMDSPVVKFVTTLFPGVAFGFDFGRWGYGGGRSLGATLLAVSFFLLFIVLLGYMISVISTGLAHGYAVIRRMKDDYLIAEETPLVSREDYANPPLHEDDETS